MTLFMRSFEAVAALLGIGILGFWLISRRLLPVQALQVLSKLALDVALPCLVFERIVSTFRPADHPGWWLMPLSWLALTVGLALFALVSLRISRPQSRREFAMALFYQNATFVPLVIMTEMAGIDSPMVLRLFFFTIFFSAFLFGTYGLFFKGAAAQTEMHKVLHPVLFVTLAAMLLRLTNLQGLVPGFLLRALAMVGQMTIPLLMLMLGGSIFLNLQQGGRLHLVEVAKFAALKNLVLPALALAVLAWLRPPPEVSFIVFLQCSVPPVTAAPVLVQRAGGDSAIVSQFLIGSFALSLLSIPAAMACFQLVFPLP